MQTHTTADQAPLANVASRSYECTTCRWTGGADALKTIHALGLRVLPGDLMPAGDCPQCGQLVHGALDLSDRTLSAVAQVMQGLGWVVEPPSDRPGEVPQHFCNGLPFNLANCSRRQLQTALDVVGFLFDDYARGDARGGSMEWEDVDATFECAKGAFHALWEEKLAYARAEAQDEEADDEERAED